MIKSSLMVDARQTRTESSRANGGRIMIHLIKLSSLLRRPVARVPGTRGGSIVSEADLSVVIEREAYQRPGAVRSWAAAQQAHMRQLLRRPTLRRFALRMLAILKEALSLAAFTFDVLEGFASEDAFLAREQVDGGAA